MDGTAGEIMTREVATARPEEDVWQMAERLVEGRFGGMPVTDPDGTLVGMVSGFDVISKRGAAVAEIMSRGVVWAQADDPIDTVITLMGRHGIRRVPICRNGKLVGLITRSDLLRHAVKQRTSRH